MYIIHIFRRINRTCTVNQFSFVFHICLQDPESGLYYHGYNNITGDHMSGIKWGRANAWAAYTMAQVGVRLPQCYLYPKFLDVVGSLNDQLAALKLCQTENGLWRTIVDDASSYEEVSASAGIAAAMITKGNDSLDDYDYGEEDSEEWETEDEEVLEDGFEGSDPNEESDRTD